MNLKIEEEQFEDEIGARSELPTCAWCGQVAIDFVDELCRQEYEISGLCQDCQDKTFKE